MYKSISSYKSSKPKGSLNNSILVNPLIVGSSSFMIFRFAIVPSAEFSINSITIKVSNKGDRPIQVGSHYHFEEVNEFLEFDRLKSRGKRLDIPSGTAVRFEPGQTRDVELIDFLGGRNIYGFNKKIMGSLK